MRRRNARQLIVSPDGALHRLPFELLPVPGGDGQTSPLLEWVGVSATPSLRWWYAMREQSLRLREKPRDALVVADPVVNSSGCEIESPIAKEVLSSRILFGRLDQSAREAEIVGGYGGLSPEVLSREEATSASLRRLNPSDFKVVHFATHALSGDTPETSLIVLSCGQKLDTLTAADIRNLKMDGQLVVLSACETNVGRPLSGESVDNLTYSFLAAGAGSVIASRKPVRDGLPVPLMEAFYDNLSRGATVEEALRAAKLRLASEGGDPTVLATFTVVGYGDSQIPLRPAAAFKIRQTIRRHPWAFLAAALLLTAGVTLALFFKAARGRPRGSSD